MHLFPGGSASTQGRYVLYDTAARQLPKQAGTLANNPAMLYQCYPIQSSHSSKNSFSIWNAGKEFVKGVFRPISSILKQPVQSAVALGGMVALASAAPVTVPLMVLAGIGLGGVQTVRGMRASIREYRQGNYEAAEKAWGQIGEGAFSVGSSLVGIRQAGAIAAEAKASTVAFSPTATVPEKLAAAERGIQAASRVRVGTWRNAFHEIGSLLSPEGWNAARVQLHPTRLFDIAKVKAQAIWTTITQTPVTEQHLVDMVGSAPKLQRYMKAQQSVLPESIQRFVSSSAHTPESIPMGVPIQECIPVAKPVADPVPFAIPVAEAIPVQEAGSFKGNTSFSKRARLAIQNMVTNLSLNKRQPGPPPTGRPTSFQAAPRAGFTQPEFRTPRWNPAVGNPAFPVRQNPAWLNAAESGYLRANNPAVEHSMTAESLIADAEQKLQQARSLYQGSSSLRQPSNARVEARLDDLLNRFDRLERSGLVPPAYNPQWAGGFYQQQPLMAQFTSLDQQFQNYAKLFNQAHSAPEPIKAVQAEPKGILTSIANFVGGILSSIARFFS